MANIYQASGEYERSGLVGLPLGTSLLSFFSLMLFYLLARKFPNVNILALVVTGLLILIYSGSVLMTRMFKMRAPQLAAWLAATGALAGLAASWLFSKHLAEPDRAWLDLALDLFYDGSRIIFQGGWSRPALYVDRYQRVNEMLALILGGLGSLAAVLLPAIGASGQARKPFSELGNYWLKKKRLNFVALLPEDHEDILKNLSDGQIDDLKSLRAGKKAIKWPKLKFTPFLIISLLTDEAAEEIYLSVTMYSRQDQITVVNSLELHDEDASWILDKFDRAAED